MITDDIIEEVIDSRWKKRIAEYDKAYENLAKTKEKEIESLTKKLNITEKENTYLEVTTGTLGIYAEQDFRGVTYVGIDGITTDLKEAHEAIERLQTRFVALMNLTISFNELSCFSKAVYTFNPEDYIKPVDTKK